MAPRAQSSLTGAISDSTSPLRRYLTSTFPHTLPLRRRYRDSGGPILVAGTGRFAAEVGAAFDYLTRFRVDPAYDAFPAIQAFLRDVDDAAVVAAVIDYAQRAVAHGDLEMLRRCCWALALTTEVYRSGRPGTELARLIRAGRFTPMDLVRAIPDAQLAELAELDQLSTATLLPALDRESVALGPTFAASRLLAADADLIAGHTLYEIKVRLGERDRATGARRDVLSVEDLYQLLGYVLFDSDDFFEIESVGLYSARYGRLTTWALQPLLDELAGRRLNLTTARDTVRQLLSLNV